MDDDGHPSIFQRLIGYLGRRRFNRSTDIEQEIQELIDAGEERGLISLQEGDMIHGVLELAETDAREIMVPRTDIIGIPENATIQDIIDLANQYGHSRYPVYRENLDNIQGILHVKDLLSCWGRNADEQIVSEVQRPPFFVPGSKKINELLKELMDSRSHMAVISDEYGGTDGLATIEDIIEEIVGEIHDEHDPSIQMISSIDEHTYLVDARTDIEDLEDSLGVKFPEGEYESVGGFLIHLFGRVPASNEEIIYEDLTFIIQSADPRRIEEVRIERPLSPRSPNP